MTDGARPVTEPLVDFGRPHWFEPPDDRRRFFWDRSAAAALTGPGGLDLRPGLLVCDVGCGWGYLGHLLLPSLSPGGRVDGFDLNEEALDTARRRTREAGARGLRFEPGDACALDLDPDRYDRAVCQTVLIHQSDPLRVLREMARVVKPGGLVVAIEPDLAVAALGRRDGAASTQQVLDATAVHLHVEVGAARSGAGQYALGGQLPSLFAHAGLESPRAWLNPTLCQCTPPYDAAGEAWRQVLLTRSEAASEDAEWQAIHPLFEAGGGDPALWRRARDGAERARQERRRRLVEGSCAVTSSEHLVVCVGRVP